MHAIKIIYSMKVILAFNAATRELSAFSKSAFNFWLSAQNLRQMLGNGRNTSPKTCPISSIVGFVQKLSTMVWKIAKTDQAVRGLVMAELANGWEGGNPKSVAAFSQTIYGQKGPRRCAYDPNGISYAYTFPCSSFPSVDPWLLDQRGN